MTLAHAEFQSDFQLPAVGGFHYRGYGGMLQMILYTAVLGRMKFSQMDGFCGAISSCDISNEMAWDLREPWAGHANQQKKG